MFPERTKFFKTPIDWEDLGKVDKITKVINGETVERTKVCTMCNRDARIGRDKDGIFYFCPRCLDKKVRIDK